MARKDSPKQDAEKEDAAVAKQAQANIEQETEQGFRGLKIDPTPNENYTAAGVTSDKPTPETDEKLAAKARQSVFGR